MANGQKTGGRAKGTANKKTTALIEAVEQGGITPLDYMLGIMRDERALLADRMEMAKAAAPYVHSRLQATTISGNPDQPLVHEIRVTIVDPKE